MSFTSNRQIVSGVVALVFLVTLGSPHALAQSSAVGTVSGQVTDRQDALIPGAVIVLTDTSTNGTQSTVSNASGRYIFPNVPPGTYNVTVSKSGFTQAKLQDQTVEVGLVRTLNVTSK
jgi:hypothetical protein